MLSLLKNWTLFEKIWIVTAVLTITAVSLLLGDTPLGFIAAISGILSVIFAAKGKSVTFLFGAISTVPYAYIAFGYHLYGVALFNLLFGLPMQLVGWLIWRRHRTGKTVRGEDIAIRKLSLKRWLVIAPIALIAIAGCTALLTSFSAEQTHLSSVTIILNIGAQILMTLRYAEQWLLWIAFDVATIAIWAIALVTTGGGDWAVLAMWCAYLVNAVYGYRNWMLIAKQAPPPFLVESSLLKPSLNDQSSHSEHHT